MTRPLGFSRFAGSANLVIDGSDGSSTTWASIERAQISSPGVYVARSSYDALSVVAHHLDSGCEVGIVSGARADEGLLDQLQADGFNIGGMEVREAAQTRSAEPDRLWIFTSGSTGRPKSVAHSLSTLTTVSDDQPPRRWLCPFSPGTYAWWQLITLSISASGQDLVVIEPSAVGGWVEVANRHSVTAVSGTSTFWRQTLLQQGNDLRGSQIQQITLGGEPVDQAILDAIREALPNARVSWIYASTEAGASIVVHDGLAGFPISFLDRSRRSGVRVAVEDGELFVESPHRGIGIDRVLATGDKVEVIDDRIHIVGRVSADEINVGGNKVSASGVRDTLQGHPDIVWAQVRGRRAPLVGSMVVADVVTRKGIDWKLTEESVLEWCRKHLSEYAVPRLLRRLDDIPNKETLKSDI